MSIPTDYSQLTKLFADLGAAKPELWAKSQLEKGIPQLHRFLFLKGAWQSVVSEGDSSWIEREIGYGKKNPSGPDAGLGQALARCREKGVADSDLIQIARSLQAKMIFSIGYLIDDPGVVEDSVDGVFWGLFPLDEDGGPMEPSIGGLHESVFETDPSDREMRPDAKLD